MPSSRFVSNNLAAEDTTEPIKLRVETMVGVDVGVVGEVRGAELCADLEWDNVVGVFVGDGWVTDPADEVDGDVVEMAAFADRCTTRFASVIASADHKSHITT